VKRTEVVEVKLEKVSVPIAESVEEKLAADIVIEAAAEAANSEVPVQVPQKETQEQEVTQEKTQDTAQELLQEEPQKELQAVTQELSQEVAQEIQEEFPSEVLQQIPQETLPDDDDAELRMKGAYHQLKELLVPEADQDLAAEVPDEQPGVKEATKEAEEEVRGPREPRTAAEILAAATEIAASDELYHQHTSRVLIIRSLVARQERLHDSLSTIRRQFYDMDQQVTSLRNERFVYQPVERKKHKWSRLLK